MCDTYYQELKQNNIFLQQNYFNEALANKTFNSQIYHQTELVSLKQICKKENTLASIITLILQIRESNHCGRGRLSNEHSLYEGEPGWSDRCQVANSRFKLSIINTYTMLIEAINVGIIGIPFLCETFKGQCIFELYDTNIPAEGW